jgi:hypothetical protein
MVENDSPCVKCNPKYDTEPCYRYPNLIDCPDYKKWYDEVLTTLSAKAVVSREACIKYLKEIGITIHTITCDLCLDRDSCEWSYDPYNTEGDCLAEK